MPTLGVVTISGWWWVLVMCGLPLFIMFVGAISDDEEVFGGGLILGVITLILGLFFCALKLVVTISLGGS